MRYRLACAADPRALGIETETGDWRLDAFLAHSQMCKACRGLQRETLAGLKANVNAPLTTSDAAAILGISRRRVQKLIADGRLPARRVGRDWLIRARDLRKVAVRTPGRPRAP